MFNEIDCIVCWDVSDEDKQAMENRNLDINEVNNSCFSNNDRIIPNSTHKLVLSGLTAPIYVIDLKNVLEES